MKKIDWMSIILAEPKTKYFQLSDEEKKSGDYKFKETNKVIN